MKGFRKSPRACQVCGSTSEVHSHGPKHRWLCSPCWAAALRFEGYRENVITRVQYAHHPDDYGVDTWEGNLREYD